MIFAIFLIFLFIVYHVVKITAEKLGALRTNFLSIFFCFIFESAITGYIKKTIDNQFILFIFSILLASIVFKYVLSIDTL